MRKQLRLEAASIEAVKTEVAVLYGPRARLVAAERVTVGGIRGFFARSHFEVTVEIPSAPAEAPTYRLPESTRRAGLMALLEDADRDEASFNKVVAPADPPVSTATDAFAILMDDLTFNVVPPETVSQPPSVLAGAGDLVVCAGLRSEADDAARLLSSTVGIPGALFAGVRDPHVPGMRLENRRVENRREAMEARARGVEKSEPVVVAFGVGGGADVSAGAIQLAGLGPDQVWLVVDAGRKSEDTRAWVELMCAAVPVAGLVVTGASATRTPETVDALGLPVGWVDGKRTSRSAPPASTAPPVPSAPSPFGSSPTLWDIPHALGYPSPFGTVGPVGTPTSQVSAPAPGQRRGIE
ncbi:hypothetical protein [Arthrobacter roseus]|uniref:hypothetical protein n=1 Tax=Arthrobacter roseus TaxID=136274 RepID=UPI0019663E5A|nr:hypothetical protein [Arthrobacter roseus]MBM7847679.1 hypothetical protein [Arthrobacter roseus]